MLDLLEKMTPASKVSAPVAPAILAETANPNGFLPDQYQKIIDKHFDPADGFTARLVFPEQDESGREMGGITFVIIVPPKFTNMSAAHKSMYKQDVRLIALRPENIIRGIESWCVKVAKNLKYNRKAVVK